MLGCNQKCFIYIVKIAACLTYIMIIDIVIFILITDGFAIPISRFFFIDFQLYLALKIPCKM